GGEGACEMAVLLDGGTKLQSRAAVGRHSALRSLASRLPVADPAPRAELRLDVHAVRMGVLHDVCRLPQILVECLPGGDDHRRGVPGVDRTFRRLDEQRRLLRGAGRDRGPRRLQVVEVEATERPALPTSAGEVLLRVRQHRGSPRSLGSLGGPCRTPGAPLRCYHHAAPASPRVRSPPPSLTEGQRAGGRAGQTGGRAEGQIPTLSRLSAGCNGWFGLASIRLPTPSLSSRTLLFMSVFS